MPTAINPLEIRRRLGRDRYAPPVEFGTTGWRFDALRGERLRILVSEGPVPSAAESGEWLHASISAVDRMPTYDELQMMHRAVWGETGWAYQVFAPVADHVNIHPYVLHLWGRMDGRAELPNFGLHGMI